MASRPRWKNPTITDGSSLDHGELPADGAEERAKPGEDVVIGLPHHRPSKIGLGERPERTAA
jgi:hypothetical protein